MQATEQTAEVNQFGLLTRRRFAPFFATQFLGAFNDNLYKNTLILVLAFVSTADLPFSSDVLINVAAMLFILPFFIFSATAGQIADKYDKAWLIRRIKFCEIGIMLLAAFAFLTNTIMALFALLFLMGMQSSFFGPVKYSILPQHLHETELVGGNALVETGTFVAIILGLVGANLLFNGGGDYTLAALGVVCVAVLGWGVSCFIPAAPAAADSVRINWNAWTQTRVVMRHAMHDDAVFNSILAISWFWFLGSAYLTQIPNFTRVYLHGSADVVTMVLCVFSLGIGVGSLLCERLSGHKVEIGLVPFGALGLSIFGVDLYFSVPAQSAGELFDVATYLAQAGSIRVLVDLLLIGVFGGLFIVPLFALVQLRTPAPQRAQVIAANNVFNALFMVIAAVLGVVLLELAGLSIPEFFLVLAVMNIVVTLYVFQRVPEFAMRFLIWLLSHTMYRVQHQALEEIPEEGGALLVCNHVSYVDALLLGGACRRPIRFVMYKPIFDIPVLNFVFRTGKAIPITSQHEDKQAYQQALDAIAAGLEDGDLLCIFPEGKLTTDGEMNEFKKGVELIVERTPVPVIPLALRGLWGSFFSHRGGHALSKLPRRFWSKVSIVAGASVPAAQVSANDLFERVKTLRGEWR